MVEVAFGILIGGIIGLLINIMCTLYRIDGRLKMIMELEQKVSESLSKIAEHFERENKEE